MSENKSISDLTYPELEKIRDGLFEDYTEYDNDSNREMPLVLLETIELVSTEIQKKKPFLKEESERQVKKYNFRILFNKLIGSLLFIVSVFIFVIGMRIQGVMLMLVVIYGVLMSRKNLF